MKLALVSRRTEAACADNDESTVSPAIAVLSGSQGAASTRPPTVHASCFSREISVTV
jgi:hypothetical protein